MAEQSKLKVINSGPEPEEVWYQRGLRFQCTGCGKCCTGGPGYVWVSEEEILLIADYLKQSVQEVKRLYLRQKDNRYALIEKPSQNFDCIFLKDKQCTIYEARPRQCRTFPWWVQNLKSEESWLEAATYCEGISDESPLVQLEEIQKNLL